MEPHGDIKTDICVHTLSDGTTLRMLILTGGEAWRHPTSQDVYSRGRRSVKTAHVGPKNLLEHWNDSFPRSVLSQTKHCRTPEKVPGTNWCRVSFSLSLASLPFVFRYGSSSKVGKKQKKRNAQSQPTYRSHTKSLRVLSGLKDCTSRDTMMPKCNIYQDEVVSVFPMTSKIPHKKYRDA